MVSRRLFPLGVVAVILALAGCAKDITLSYSPSAAPAEVKLKSAKTIRVDAFADKRIKSWPVVKGDAGKVISDAIRAELANQGYQIVERGGDLVISGNLIALDPEKTSGVFPEKWQCGVQMSITVRDTRENEIVWTEIVSGRSEPLEVYISLDTEKAANLAIAQLIGNVVNSLSLHAALR